MYQENLIQPDKYDGPVPTLREHQVLADKMIRESIMSGNRRPVVAAPTAFGKTVLAAHLMRQAEIKGNRGWFICDRIKLVDQTMDKFRQFGIDFGVHQADHYLTDPRKLIQIASQATLNAMVFEHGKRLPEMDFVIVDEAHVLYKIVKHIGDTYNNIIIIGLSATPYSKGLGDFYNNLLIPATPKELLEKGYLTPVRYFVGKGVDTSKVNSDCNSFSAKGLIKAVDDQSDILAGSIEKNWFEHAQDLQTIAFSPSQKHSKYLVEMFKSAGVDSAHIDCYSSQEERDYLYKAHDAGELKILSCAELLNTGYDSPSTSAIIDCYPTKSAIKYQQRGGRITRLFEGKHYSVYLDHAGNFKKFGYFEDMVPDRLHSSEDDKFIESELVAKREKATIKCPSCGAEIRPPKCSSCGFEIKQKSKEMQEYEQLIDDGTELVEVQKESDDVIAKKANKKDSIDIKSKFFSELIQYGKNKGYKPGWAKNKYREKYGVWPNKIKSYPTTQTKTASNWVRYEAIKRKHSS